MHHVTHGENVKQIKKEGLVAGMVCAEANMAGCTDEDFEDIEEMNEEERVRHAFNDILSWNKPKKEFPGHDYGNFFWSKDMTARYHRKAMDKKNPDGNYRIVQVYSPKIACKCYESDFQAAEDLFQLVTDNIDDVERINNTGAMDKKDESLEKKADKLAKDYYKTMKKWSGKEDSEKEIICPCNISKESIVRIV